jgi:GTPase SAR1 family protein
MTDSGDKKSRTSLDQVKSKIKVVFLGNQSAGKTSILLRFMQNKFEEGQAVRRANAGNRGH